MLSYYCPRLANQGEDLYRAAGAQASEKFFSEGSDSPKVERNWHAARGARYGPPSERETCNDSLNLEEKCHFERMEFLMCRF